MGRPIVLASAFLIGGCAEEVPRQRLPEPGDICGRRIITRAELGDKWPLTVDSGEISRTVMGACFFTHNGVKFALKGTATNGKSWNKSVDITPIWRPSPEEAKYHQPGPAIVRINIGGLIAEANKLCKEDTP